MKKESKLQEPKTTDSPNLQYIPKVIEMNMQAPDSFIEDSPRKITEDTPIGKIIFSTSK